MGLFEDSGRRAAPNNPRNDVHVQSESEEGSNFRRFLSSIYAKRDPLFWILS